MLSVVCWKWRPMPGYRSAFGPEAVNTLRRMVARHYDAPHRFICVTDDPEGLDPEVEAVPLWTDHADVPSPHGGHNPSCYRRLRAFAPDAAQWFGDRFVSVDLDTVIVGDLKPLWDRPEDFVIWGDTAKGTWYNGSMFMLRTGTRAKVWEQFNPSTSPAKAKAAGCFGSDQGWLSYILGPKEAKWGCADGVYSYRVHIAKAGNRLPPNARITMWHGHVDPWSLKAQRLPWVQEHYQ